MHLTTLLPLATTALLASANPVFPSVFPTPLAPTALPPTAVSTDGSLVSTTLPPVDFITPTPLNPVGSIPSVTLNPVDTLPWDTVPPLHTFPSSILAPLGPIPSEVLSPLTPLPSEILEPLASVPPAVLDPIGSIVSTALASVPSITSAIAPVVASAVAAVPTIVPTNSAGGDLIPGLDILPAILYDNILAVIAILDVVLTLLNAGLSNLSIIKIRDLSLPVQGLDSIVAEGDLGYTVRTLVELTIPLLNT